MPIIKFSIKFRLIFIQIVHPLGYFIITLRLNNIINQHLLKKEYQNLALVQSSS